MSPDFVRRPTRRPCEPRSQRTYCLSDLRKTRIKLQGALRPFRGAKQVKVLSVSADELDAERQAMFAETRGQRYRGRAEQGPWRAIFGVAGGAETFRGFAERRHGQDGIDA